MSWQKGTPNGNGERLAGANGLYLLQDSNITRITIWPCEHYQAKAMCYVYSSKNCKCYGRKLTTPRSQPNEVNGVPCFCVWFSSPLICSAPNL